MPVLLLVSCSNADVCTDFSLVLLCALRHSLALAQSCPCCPGHMQPKARAASGCVCVCVCACDQPEEGSALLVSTQTSQLCSRPRGWGVPFSWSKHRGKHSSRGASLASLLPCACCPCTILLHGGRRASMGMALFAMLLTACPPCRASWWPRGRYQWLRVASRSFARRSGPTWRSPRRRAAACSKCGGEGAGQPSALCQHNAGLCWEVRGGYANLNDGAIRL